MNFNNTKKYLFDIAPIRLNCKIEKINDYRQKLASQEYVWETGKEKNLKSKYRKLTNKEISKSNPPLVGQIRNGKINSKNPYLYTPTVLIDVYNNCKIIPGSSTAGLTEDEERSFRIRNCMFLSYDDILFGDRDERYALKIFFRTAIILDILFEKQDQNLWRLVLAYVPLNIMFERIKLKVKDVNKVYMILKSEYLELLLTGVFRVTQKHLFDIPNGFDSIESLFRKFCDDTIKVRYEGQNKLIGIEKVLEEFYETKLKDIIENDVILVTPSLIEDTSPIGIFNYQSLESVVAIQNEMNTMKEYLDDDPDRDYKNRYQYVTEALKSIENLLDALTSLQDSEENSDHWNGNFLGYIKKYHNGDEIVRYFSSGDSEILVPLIRKSIKDQCIDFELRKMYKKKHPESWLFQVGAELFKN